MPGRARGAGGAPLSLPPPAFPSGLPCPALPLARAAAAWLRAGWALGSPPPASREADAPFPAGPGPVLDPRVDHECPALTPPRRGRHKCFVAASEGVVLWPLVLANNESLPAFSSPFSILETLLLHPLLLKGFFPAEQTRPP